MFPNSPNLRRPAASWPSGSSIPHSFRTFGVPGRSVRVSELSVYFRSVPTLDIRTLCPRPLFNFFCPDAACGVVIPSVCGSLLSWRFSSLAFLFSGCVLSWCFSCLGFSPLCVSSLCTNTTAAQMSKELFVLVRLIYRPVWTRTARYERMFVPFVSVRRVWTHSLLFFKCVGASSIPLCVDEISLVWTHSLYFSQKPYFGQAVKLTELSSALAASLSRAEPDLRLPALSSRAFGHPHSWEKLLVG